MITNSIFIFLSAFILVYYSIKKIIYISHKKHLFDEPSEDRKIHHTKTPNLGGVAIFSSITITACLFFPLSGVSHLNYIILSSLILFIVGLTDDLVGVNPAKKIIAQLLVAFTITLLADCRFTNFYGLFGLNEMPFAISILLSSLFIIFLINAFNLIDGINCLSGSIGFLACVTFAFYFLRMHQAGLLFVSVAMCGCLAGFLLFNKTPAKIFMGDTGSIFLGFIVAMLSIKFIELSKTGSAGLMQPEFQSAPGLVFGLLIIPVFDTLRIFSLRILKRKSPFRADRNHIHHRLIDLKFSHLQTTGILMAVNIFCLLLVFFLAHLLKTEILLLIITGFILILNAILSLIHLKQIKRTVKKIDYSSYSIPKHRIIVRDNTVLK
jgi:UDP-GlcNAc:undecaprenyl-phosphate/decaprenyl-phosphate GlcNAc-1-phosphate transferase